MDCPSFQEIVIALRERLNRKSGTKARRPNYAASSGEDGVALAVCMDKVFPDVYEFADASMP